MLNRLVLNKGEFVFFKSTLSTMIFLFSKTCDQLSQVMPIQSLFCRLFQSLIAHRLWLSWNHRFLFSLVVRSGNFLSYCFDVVPFQVWKRYEMILVNFLFIWSHTNCKLLRVTMSINWKIVLCAEGYWIPMGL